MNRLFDIPLGWCLLTDGNVREGDRVLMLGQADYADAAPAHYGMWHGHFQAVIRLLPLVEETPLESEVDAEPTIKVLTRGPKP